MRLVNIITIYEFSWVLKFVQILVPAVLLFTRIKNTTKLYDFFFGKDKNFMIRGLELG